MGDVLDSNLKEINMLNPRSRRTLSIIDLIKLGMVSLELAAYLISGVRRGAGFLIGAIPSNAGKTTLMAALLGVLPSSNKIITIEDENMISELTRRTEGSAKTYVIHEISDWDRGRDGWGRGGWGSYLGIQSVANIARFVDNYSRLAATIHADSVEDIKESFLRFGFEDVVNLFDFIIFLRHDPWNPPRVVDEVWEFSPQDKLFLRVYSRSEGFKQNLMNTSNSSKNNQQIKWEAFINYCLQKDLTSLKEVAYALRDYS